MKDKEDIALEALFRSAPIADDGFTRRVVGRVRRRLWITRLALPTAFVLGLAIAAKPALALISSLSGIVALLPLDGIAPLRSMLEAAGTLPQTSMVMFIGVATVAVMFLLPALDD